MFSLCATVGTGEGDVGDAEKLLEPYLKKYPKVSHQYCLVWWEVFAVKEVDEGHEWADAAVVGHDRIVTCGNYIYFHVSKSD